MVTSIEFFHLPKRRVTILRVESPALEERVVPCAISDPVLAIRLCSEKGHVTGQLLCRQ